VQELSVVIPTLSRAGTLRMAMDALDAQAAPSGSFEVIVAADAADSNRGAVEDAIAGRPYEARLVSAGVPGTSAARNRGWRDATTPLILFLDDDVLAGPRLVAQHLAWHRERPNPEIGVLGYVRWARSLKMTPFMRWLERGIQFDYSGIQGEEAGWGRFYTANASVKRQLLERSGGFDEERLPFGYEDLDLAYRMSRLGFQLLYNRRAEAEHLHPMDLDFWRRRMPRVAASERSFVALHPEIRPYFHELLRDAAESPPARGWGRHLVRIVPPWLPWLGPRAWASADLYYRQALASHFFEAWEAAEA
jgi:GT2 family glycosyltransferase